MVLASDAELLFLIAEEVNSITRLGFNQITTGDSSQNVNFADLTDFKGNSLPAEIDSPKIITVPRSEYNAFVIGNESDFGFKIARDPNAPGTIDVDLYIFEMGTA